MKSPSLAAISSTRQHRALLATSATLALALLTLPPVSAAEVIPEALKACMTLRRDNERLACYDHALANLQAGSGAPAPSAENMFGASTHVTPPAKTAEAPKREELKQITGKVDALHKGDDGLYVLTLDNGQVWRQQDSEVTLFFESGDTVTITRASLGTFRVTDKRGRTARVKRVR